YNRFHLVNTYGAFGSVTRERYEVVIEGTDSPTINDQTQWREYAFQTKPGNPARMPPQISPYPLRLRFGIWVSPFLCHGHERGRPGASIRALVFAADSKTIGE